MPNNRAFLYLRLTRVQVTTTTTIANIVRNIFLFASPVWKLLKAEFYFMMMMPSVFFFNNLWVLQSSLGLIIVFWNGIVVLVLCSTVAVVLPVVIWYPIMLQNALSLLNLLNFCNCSKEMFKDQLDVWSTEGEKMLLVFWVATIGGN